jgi:hypothetical protein
MSVQVHRNTALSAIAVVEALEPSVATAQGASFYTSWRIFYLSSDSGISFQQPSHGSAGSIFPEGFSDDYVDQSAIWSPLLGRFVWAMLRKPTGGGHYVIRIAFASRQMLSSSQARRWIYFDITPEQLGLRGRHLDYPQLSLADHHLYITAHFATAALTNVEGSVIVRVALRELEPLTAGVVHFEFFSAAGIFNFGAAQRCGQRAYWAGHVSNHLTRFYWWDENSSRIFWHDVPVPAWSSRGDSYKSLTPDGHNWLSHEWGANHRCADRSRFSRVRLDRWCQQRTPPSLH